ncbi:helix-turn-helix domain-containing protein [Peribacillus frigoritolerans]|uniref:helix-turn-helix domain-containing protein n=1 Tax=Peribacillus frigoritolerans TaxID=450367 RepID=UPI0038720C02
MTNTQLNRDAFIKENQTEWVSIGAELKSKRLYLGLSLAEMSRRLGTSTTRIRKFESGKPVYMAGSLEQCYKMALRLEDSNARLNVYEMSIAANDRTSDFMEGLKSDIELHEELGHSTFWEQKILDELIEEERIISGNYDHDEDEFNERIYPTDAEIFGEGEAAE